MKRILLMVALMLVSGTTNVSADEITCKTHDASTFTVTVPKGWTSKTMMGGCLVAKKDYSLFIAVGYYQANGLNAKDFARRMCDAMKVTPKYFKNNEDYVSMDVTVHDSPVSVSISGGKNSSMQMVIRNSDDSEELEAIFDSVSF